MTTRWGHQPRTPPTPSQTVGAKCGGSTTFPSSRDPVSSGSSRRLVGGDDDRVHGRRSNLLQRLCPAVPPGKKGENDEDYQAPGASCGERRRRGLRPDLAEL